MAEMIATSTAGVTTRWWVHQPINRFVYEVYVVRDYPSLETQEYLSPYGGWVKIPVGGIMEPALTFDVRLVMTLTEAEVLDSGPIVDALRALAQKVMDDAK